MLILETYYVYIIAAVLFLIAIGITFYMAFVRARNALSIAETGKMLAAAAPAEIAAAEKALAAIEKAGEQKMQMCIDALMLIVPEKLKSVFGADVIRGIVQNAFDATEEYAKIAAEKAAKKLANKKKKVKKDDAK